MEKRRETEKERGRNRMKQRGGDKQEEILVNLRQNSRQNGLVLFFTRIFMELEGKDTMKQRKWKEEEGQKQVDNLKKGDGTRNKNEERGLEIEIEIEKVNSNKER